MNLRTASTSLGLSALLCPLLLAQVVTDTKWVDNWEEKGAPREQLRKINGRWWSQDNREVQPPGKDGGFWTLDSKPGTCQFFHHRPFQLARAESLHLFMSPPEVEAMLGKPNRTLGDGFWWYYAADGTKLSVRFMGKDGLGEAKYEYLHEKSQSVASVASDLGGRDIYKVMSDRAWKRTQEQQATKMSDFRAAHGGPGMRPSVVTAGSVPVAPSDPVPPKRIVSTEALTAIAVGATREDVLSRLGEPSSRFAITDDDGTRESFTYDLESGSTVEIRLLAGKVTKVR
jgi:hypothetical protein